MTKTTTGERIRKRRLELGLSQTELARRVGFETKGSISKIENSDRNLNQSKIKLIADALQTSPDYIMGWNDTEIIIETDNPERDGKERILRYFEKLSETNRESLLKYAEYLSKSED